MPGAEAAADLVPAEVFNLNLVVVILVASARLENSGVVVLLLAFSSGVPIKGPMTCFTGQRADWCRAEHWDGLSRVLWLNGVVQRLVGVCADKASIWLKPMSYGADTLST